MAGADPHRSAFVTGGSGFVGGALIRRLIGEGWRVRALARSDASAAKVAQLGAEPVHGDLEAAAALRAGAHGCHFAFHAAAHLGATGDGEAFERINVGGTKNVLAACRDAGVRRLVHVGTEAALLAGAPLVWADESTRLRPDSPVPYSSTKARAEIAVLGASRRGVFETIVVRPRFVWGVGDTTLLPEMVAQTRAGRFAWIGGGRHLTSTTHVENTVEGLVRGALHGTPGCAYFVTDGAPVVFREFVSALLRTQGVEPPAKSVPEPVAHLLAEVGERAWSALPLPGEPPVPRFVFWVASQECTLDDSRARRDLGYAPVITRDEGLAALRAAA